MKRVESLGFVFWIAILTGTQAQVAPSVAIFLDNVSEELFLSTKIAFNGSQAAVITVHNITGLTPFQLFKKACSTASSGAIAIATQTTCPTVLTLSYAADTLGLGFMGKEGGCASSDIHPSSAQEKYDAMEDIDQRSIHQALLSTIEALEWKEVLVIFDDEILFKRDKYLTSLDGELAGVNAFFQMFEVRNESRSADITSILSYMAEGDAYDKVLVACSVTCVKETLARAVDYDRSGVEQEFFSFAVNWLILANEDDLDAILPVVQTLNHVTVITPPSKAEMDTVVVKDLIEIVNGSVNYLKHGNYSEWEMKNTTCGIKLGLVNQTEEQMLAAFNTTLSKTAPFTYYAAMWKPGGVRRFENVARWTASDQPPAFDDVFPNVKFGFNGKHLIVGTKTWDPFVIYSANSTIGYSGFCMDLLTMMASYLNFTFELREPEDGSWGSYIDQTFNGLIGQLIRKEVDMVVAPMAISAQRSAYVDFSKPYFVEVHSAIVRYPDQKKKNWRIYLDPFQWDVWTTVVLSIPIVAVILWAFHRLSAENGETEKKQKMGQLNDALWYSFGSLLTQGSDILPGAQSGRFVVGFWLMYCLVVVASYSGNLVAFFTVSNPTLPFNTLQDIVDSDYKIGAMEGTYIYNYIMGATHGILKELANKIKFFNETDPSVVIADQNEQLAKVRSEKYVYLADGTTIQLETMTNCQVDKIKETFSPVQYGVAFWKHSAYTKAFNTGLELFIENGFEKRWRQTWWPNLNMCDRGLVTTSKPVSVSDMQGAFYLMAILLICAMISLFFELGIWKKAKMKPDVSSVEDQGGEVNWNEMRFHQYQLNYTYS